MAKRRVSPHLVTDEMIGKKIHSRGEIVTVTGTSIDGRIVYGKNSEGYEDEYYVGTGQVYVDDNDEDMNLTPWLYE